MLHLITAPGWTFSSFPGQDAGMQRVPGEYVLWPAVTPEAAQEESVRAAWELALHLVHFQYLWSQYVKNKK